MRSCGGKYQTHPYHAADRECNQSFPPSTFCNEGPSDVCAVVYACYWEWDAIEPYCREEDNAYQSIVGRLFCDHDPACNGG